jgi:acyl-CoA thioester hydrolase
MNKHIKSKDLHLKVYCEDTDFQGFVYHANYLKFFERSRTEFLIENGISQEKLLNQQLVFVVRRMGINFISPARIEDTLTISSLVHKNSNARLTFSQTAKESNSNKTLCSAEVEVCLINLETNKPKPFHNDLLLLFG